MKAYRCTNGHVRALNSLRRTPLPPQQEQACADILQASVSGENKKHRGGRSFIACSGLFLAVLETLSQRFACIIRARCPLIYGVVPTLSFLVRGRTRDC